MIKYYFHGYTYDNLIVVDNNDICINVNDIVAFQVLDKRDNNETDKENIEKGGYCVNWTFFYLYYRLQYPDDQQQNVIDNFYNLLQKKIRKDTKKDDIGFISIIRSISLFQKLFEIIFEHYYHIYSINEQEFSEIASNIFTQKFF